MTDDPVDPAVIEACIDLYRRHELPIRLFGDSVRNFFATHPGLTSGDMPDVHSVRFRMKDEGHLREKIRRKKIVENRDITPDNLFDQITDLAGVRVLHLHMCQFQRIHQEIAAFCKSENWTLHEAPKVFTWDPEFLDFFRGLGIEPLIKESQYTCVHYVVKPSPASPFTCEIQVRSLFEEVWGEIDHVLNYPVPTCSVACREQLRVLAKMVGASTRLIEAIFRSHREFVETPTAHPPAHE